MPRRTGATAGGAVAASPHDVIAFRAITGEDRPGTPTGCEHYAGGGGEIAGVYVEADADMAAAVPDAVEGPVEGGVHLDLGHHGRLDRSERDRVGAGQAGCPARR